MLVSRMLIAVMAVALLVGLGACKKDGDKKKDSKGGDMSAMDMGGGGMDNANKPKLSHKDNPKPGDSCKGLPATEGRLACHENAKIFCSSMSKYKWKKLQACGKGTKCVVADNGKSASCK